MRKGENTKPNFSSKRIELLALKWLVTEKFRDYLLGSKFSVVTDSNPLSYILKTKKLTACEQRWINALASYNFDLKFRSGQENIGPDYLSRLNHRSESEMSSDEVNSCPDEAANFTRLSPRLIQCAASDALRCLEDQRKDNAATGMPEISAAEMSKLQSEDEDLGRVMYYKKQNRLPTKSERDAESPNVKPYFRQWKQITLVNDVLYRSTNDPNGNEISQLMLPKKLQTEVLQALHDQAGHQGAERTELLLRARVYWPQLQEDVKNWIGQCEHNRRTKQYCRTLINGCNAFVKAPPGGKYVHGKAFHIRLKGRENNSIRCF